MPLTYHYCSLETACAIISNASLRLCDITKSNDSAEITYGYAAALDSLKRIGLISGSGPTFGIRGPLDRAAAPGIPDAVA